MSLWKLPPYWQKPQFWWGRVSLGILWILVHIDLDVVAPTCNTFLKLPFLNISPSHVNIENVLLEQYPVTREHASVLTVSAQCFFVIWIYIQILTG